MKTNSMTFIMPIVLVLLIASCSTSNIANRGEYIKQTSISKGLPRIDLLARFGSPIETKVNEDGKKVDLFRIEQGESTSGKILKGTGTALIAVWTLGLTELIANPITKKTDMVVFGVVYDENERVDTVNFIQLPK